MKTFSIRYFLSLPPPPPPPQSDTPDPLHIALEILVSPKQQIVGEATPVSYECLVVGHPVSSISWARDFETLSPDKVRILNI